MTDPRLEEEFREIALIMYLGIFREKEIEFLKKHFITKIKKGMVLKDDDLAYINLKLVKIMRRETSIRDPHTYISLYRRVIKEVNSIYCNAINISPTDEELMMSYMAFIKTLNDRGPVINFFRQIFRKPDCPPEMYGFAAAWCFREVGSIEMSRNIYTEGVQRFPKNDRIHLTAFAIELDYLKVKRNKSLEKESRSKNVSAKKKDPSYEKINKEPNNTVVIKQELGYNNSVPMKQEQHCSTLSEKDPPCYTVVMKKELLDEVPLNCVTSSRPMDDNSYAMNVFVCGIRSIPDPVLAFKFLEISKDYDFIYDIKEAILKYVLKKFRHSKKTCDLFIRCALRGLRFPKSWNIKVSRYDLFKRRMEDCWGVFKSALGAVNNELMWSNFIELCIKLKADKTKLRKFKRKILMDTLQEAHSQGKLAEKYYLLWVAEIMAPIKKKKLKCKTARKAGIENKKDEHHSEKIQRRVEEILVEGTVKLPTSLELWRALLRFYIRLNNQPKIVLTLKNATVALDSPQKVVELLELCLQYYQLIDTSKADILYKRAIEPGSAIAHIFIPRYLQWVALREGIDGARRVYEEYTNKRPFSMELHQKMIELENMIPTAKLLKKKLIRQCFENMCYQFGEEEPSVWINYIKFEKETGDSENIRSIRYRATVMLLPNYLDNFHASLAVLK